MNNRVLVLSVLLVLGCGLSSLYAQKTNVTTGGTATGNGGSITYSVGQIVCTNSTDPGGASIAAGVQQPYEISVLSGIEKIIDVYPDLSVYPNPTADYLILSINGAVKTGYCARLYDSHGRLISKKEVTANKTKINMQGLGSAGYLLKLTKDNKQIKVFRIIKK
ncbi:MAG: T9SS type A sorting domain-containing protein [Bacteroidales bacterium]|nr:T9SS type A sorting domain-containing protein [Bacteroidales bacterium]